jgi:hypothetical protein
MSKHKADVNSDIGKYPSGLDMIRAAISRDTDSPSDEVATMLATVTIKTVTVEVSGAPNWNVDRQPQWYAPWRTPFVVRPLEVTFTARAEHTDIEFDVIGDRLDADGTPTGWTWVEHGTLGHPTTPAWLDTLANRTNI